MTTKAVNDLCEYLLGGLDCQVDEAAAREALALLAASTAGPWSRKKVEASWQIGGSWMSKPALIRAMAIKRKGRVQ